MPSSSSNYDLEELPLLDEAGSSVKEIKFDVKSFATWWWKLVLKFVDEHTYAVVWAAWITVGTIFYAFVDFGGDFPKGLYMAVNVGYSIGWGNLLDKNDPSKVFSIIYLLVGAIFVSNFIVSIVEGAVSEGNNSLENKIIADHIRRSSSLKGTLLNFYIYVVLHNSKLMIIYVWFIYVIIGGVCSCVAIGWSFLDGIYFAVSSLSTGGLWAVPLSSDDYVWAAVGLYSAIGVPIMVMAVGNIAALIFEARHESQRAKGIKQEDDVTLSREELIILDADSNTVSGKTAVDFNQYLLMYLVRENGLTLGQMRKLHLQFSRMDTKGVGSVTLSALLAQHAADQQKQMPKSGTTSPFKYPAEVNNGLHQKLSIRLDAEDDEVKM